MLYENWWTKRRYLVWTMEVNASILFYDKYSLIYLIFMLCAGTKLKKLQQRQGKPRKTKNNMKGRFKKTYKKIDQKYKKK
jgi:hypothetical protein